MICFIFTDSKVSFESVKTRQYCWSECSSWLFKTWVTHLALLSGVNRSRRRPPPSPCICVQSNNSKSYKRFPAMQCMQFQHSLVWRVWKTYLLLLQMCCLSRDGCGDGEVHSFDAVKVNQWKLLGRAEDTGLWAQPRVFAGSVSV